MITDLITDFKDYTDASTDSACGLIPAPTCNNRHFEPRSNNKPENHAR